MGSTHTRLRVVNNTNTDIIDTTVSEVDNFDYVGVSRPNRNFQGVFIASRDYEERREELKNGAKNAPFKMTLHFRNGLKDTFKINQKYAFGNGYWANFRHYPRSHLIDYDRESDPHYKVIITVKNTKQQLENQEAEEQNAKAEDEMRRKQYETAMKKLERALKLANQSSTISSIKRNMSLTCNELGKLRLQKAFDLEANTSEDKSDEAKSKFDEARRLFKKGHDYYNVSDQKKNLDITIFKINGNRLFNEGNELEKKGFELFENARKTNNANDYNQAENIFKQALVKYEEAKKQFEEGAKLDSTRFDDSAKIADEMITETAKVIENIDRIQLPLNMNQLTVDERNKDREELLKMYKNLEKQIEEIEITRY